MFIHERESFQDKRKIKAMSIEPGLYPRMVDIAVAMKNKNGVIPGAQVFEYNGSYVSIDDITQQIAIQLTEDQPFFVFQNTTLSQMLTCELEQIQTKVMVSQKRPYYTQYSYVF